MHNRVKEMATIDSLAEVLTRCIESAVGDDIKEDVELNQLKTQNSTPFRIWDHMNTRFISEINKIKGIEYIAKATTRGFWKFVPVFDVNQGILYTIMREPRFKEIQRTVLKRGSAHYVDALAREINPDILADNNQMEFFETNIFTDGEKTSDIVKKILCDLHVEQEEVKRYIIVLFNSDSNALSSIRAVKVDKNLNVVSQENWNAHITLPESVIMDNISDVSEPSNNPTHGMKLKAKATERKELLSFADDEQNKKDEA